MGAASLAGLLLWGLCSAPDAGPLNDGGALGPGTASPEQATRAPAPTHSSTTSAVPTPEEISELKRESAALSQLLRGELPDAYEIRSLFEIDVRNKEALRARRNILRGEIAAVQQRRTELLKKTGGSTTSLALISDDAARLGVLDALLERSKSRLEFFETPASFRETLLHTEERSRSIRNARQEAESERAEAEQDGLRAEQARQKAMRDARNAKTEAERALAAERARIEAYRVTLAGLRGDLASTRERWASMQAALLQSHDALSKPVYDPAITVEQADKIFDQLIPVLQEGHRKFDDALGRLTSESRIAQFVPEVDGSRLDFSSMREAHAKIQKDMAMVQEEATLLAQQEAELRFQRADGYAQDLSHLNQVRLDLFPRITPDKRARTLGFTEQGFRQLLLEAGHVRDMSRWYLVQRVRRPSKAQGLRSYVTLGLAGLELLKLLVLLGVAFYFRRHHKAALASFRIWSLKRIDNRNVRLLADRWLRFFQANAFSAGLLVFAYLFFDFGGWKITEVRVLRAVVISYAWYRFLRALSLHMITEAAQAGRVFLSMERRQRIHSSVSLVGRYLLVVAVFLLISKELVGEGYLHGLVRKFFWLGSIPLALILIRRWRTDIADTYLSMYPNGRFAASVASTRERPSGFFVVVAAFGSVAGRGIASYFKRTALSFEQTRRALAFMFRRRLEKQAAEQGVVARTVDLPVELADAFNEYEATAEQVIDNYPGLEDLLAKIESLAELGEEGEGESCALVGERGAGKTTWLDELNRRSSSIATVRIPLPDRPGPKQILERVADAFESPNGCTQEELIDHIKGGAPRLVIIDNCQNLMLRSVGGTHPYEIMMDVVSRTTKNTVWVLAFSRHAWRHLEARYSGRNLFSEVIELSAWPEAQIARLISKRMTLAGFQASYDDLVVDRVEGTSFDSALVRTKERFNRLLWDYSNGNPRIALHFWKEALDISGNKNVRVRMFAYPPEEELGGLNESSRFALTAITIHENLTAEELSEVLDYPTAFCKSVIARLEQDDLLERRGPRVRIDTHYYRTVVRFLRRNHLLHG